MSEQTIYYNLLGFGFAIAAIVFGYLFFVSAPYGRHARGGWGPGINPRLAWVLMETPAVVAIAFFALTGQHASALMTWVFLAIWESHYVYRAFFYPFRIRLSDRKMPITIVLMGMTFNVANGYLNGRYLGQFGPVYEYTWLFDPRFLIGLAMFAGGYAINHRADSRLRNLREPGETGYKIPQGGMFKWISCPNYFGELIEWIGWAVLTWSWPGLFFAVWTAANLVPRAITHHRWYQSKFEDYPPDRKAIIPFLL